MVSTDNGEGLSLSKKIRVLELIDDASVGGGPIHVLLLASCLDRRAFDVTIACESRGYLVDEAVKRGIRALPIEMGNRLRARTLKSVVRLLGDFEFDILHTHGGTAGFWGRVGSALAGKPLVRIHTYHGMHYLNEYTQPFTAWGKTLLERSLLKWTHRAICVCESDYRKGLDAGIVTEEKGVVIPCGIPLSKYQQHAQRDRLRAEFGVDDSTIVFGHVGRLHAQKGQRYLLDAFRTVTAEHPHAALWIIGEGELRGELMGFARDLGVESAATFLGARTDIPEILSAVDVFVLPSLWEGQPLSVLEAMAAGKPIIASRVDGIREILVDGVNALLVPAANAEQLAEAMMRVIQNRELATRLSTAARETLPETFSAETMAIRIGDLYQKIYYNRVDIGRQDDFHRGLLRHGE